MERLQKVLQAAGVASRRKAEEMIAEGKVSVNGVITTQMGVMVADNDRIFVGGKELKREKKVYYALNKPTGYISTTSDEHGRPAVIDLVQGKERVFPVGRLDYDASGIILLTNDGDFMNQLIHPRYKVEKEYHLKVKGLVRKETSAKLARGVDLGDFVSQPAKVFDVKYDDAKENTYLKIIVTEGKYHQVKRMLEAVGHPVMKLHRYRMGCVTTEGIPLGGYRLLKLHEIRKLWNLSNNGK
ncbi:MAG TPA: pseudouridine synthase [Bacillota bacterium]|nr:pseudouridine synthase [Bacillota bacterium]HPF42108.1 pseudouridine synthase [Bacillota bacterium]HPJ85365.1 pseudouridine synthase [Bacillota bacterium]HPQ61339.1 pseudouridine synthase [Bacillota bacterium]HRX91942.1 pseudouridine synthase [Candidatus Izemoplasmatales bacterium]